MTPDVVRGPVANQSALTRWRRRGWEAELRYVTISLVPMKDRVHATISTERGETVASIQPRLPKRSPVRIRSTDAGAIVATVT
jgi:hypothetical protein